jgi:hypothetical protein
MPDLFNVHGFGPPHPFTGTSTCPLVVHLVSGLSPATYRAFQTRFRYGSAPEVLNQAAENNSPVHYATGTPSLGPPEGEHRAPTAWRYTVSGSYNSPSRGSFHLSVTLLVHYRSSSSNPPRRVGPPASHGGPRAPCYSGEQMVTRGSCCRVRDCHPLWCAFPSTSANNAFVTALCFRNPGPKPG